MKVDSLDFSYDAKSWTACKFDELSFFKKAGIFFQYECECIQCGSHNCQKKTCVHFNICTRKQKQEGLKGVDVLLKNDRDLYLIEMKDYRKTVKPPIDHIVSEVAKKFRDSLFVLWCASIAADDPQERRLADEVRRKQLSLTFVFHFESPVPPYASGLFSPQRGVQSLSGVYEKLKRKMQFMLGHVFITDMAHLQSEPNSFPWKVK